MNLMKKAASVVVAKLGRFVVYDRPESEMFVVRDEESNRVVMLYTYNRASKNRARNEAIRRMMIG
jgi:hypothetical protein